MFLKEMGSCGQRFSCMGYPIDRMEFLIMKKKDMFTIS